MSPSPSSPTGNGGGAGPRGAPAISTPGHPGAAADRGTPTTEDGARTPHGPKTARGTHTAEDTAAESHLPGRGHLTRTDETSTRRHGTAAQHTTHTAEDTTAKHHVPARQHTTHAARGGGRPAAPEFAVVGNPENRRTAMFAAAVRAAGHPAPRVLAWRDVLRGRYAFTADEFVRIDSPGENTEVDRLLRDADDPTRVEGTALWHRRFTTAVREVAQAALDAGAAVSADAQEIAVLFDKRRCHARLAAAGVPVPPALTGPVGGWEELKEQLRAAGISRAFVKPAHGSSASGVVALALGTGRVRATTSVETASDGRLFNSLQVRHHTSEREVAALVNALAPDGIHVERWLPKASQQGRAADLRVVVVAGRATHAVLRTSRHPMTNLHLGGGRGDLDAARAAIRAAGGSFGRVLDVAERAAGCFPGTLCVGVDILPATGWRHFAIGEVNAFGDLLPGLTGLPGSGAEGLDTYGAQVDAVLRRTELHEERRHVRVA